MVTSNTPLRSISLNCAFIHLDKLTLIASIQVNELGKTWKTIGTINEQILEKCNNTNHRKKLF